MRSAVRDNNDREYCCPTIRRLTLFSEVDRYIGNIQPFQGLRLVSLADTFVPLCTCSIGVTFS